MEDPEIILVGLRKGQTLRPEVPRYCVLSDCGLRGPSTNERLGNAHLSQGLGGCAREGSGWGGVQLCRSGVRVEVHRWTGVV